MDQIYTIKK